MELLHTAVADGVTVHTLYADRFKTGYLSINFLLPLRRETASLAAMLPHVLKRGTVSYPDMTALNRRLDMLYATTVAETVSRIGEQQCISFRVNFLDHRFVTDGTDLFREATELLRELFFSPVTENGVFRADYVATEQQAQIDAIESRINNKGVYAVIRCREIMCREEHYSVSSIGTTDGVAAITPESLYAFYCNLLRTARVEIFYVGRLDHKTVSDAMARLWQNRPRDFHPLPATTVLRRALSETKSVSEEAPVKQGKLVLGFRTDRVLTDGDYEVFSTFLALYGASPTSKLFRNVRERLSLCYSCRANADPQKGVMMVSCGISPADRDAAQREILAQLDEVREGHITEDELNSAKKVLLGSYREMNDSPLDIEGYFLGRIIAGVDGDPIRSMERVRAVTAEEIASAARAVTLDTVYFLTSPDGTDAAEEEEDI